MASSSLLPTTAIASSIASQQAQQVWHSTGLATTEQTIEQLRREKRQRRQWTVLVGSVAGVTVVVSLAAMISQASLICYLAFGLPTVVAPWLIVQRHLLNRAPTLRGQIQLARQHISRLAQQNTRFAAERQRLEEQLTRLQALERELNTIVSRQGTNVHDFRLLLQEHSIIQKKRQNLLKADQLQMLFQALLDADTNQDFVLTENEFERLCIRLQAFNMVAQERIKKILLHSAVGQTNIQCLFRDLQQEVLADDYYLEEADPYQMIMGKGMSAEKLGCGDVDNALSTYQCMD